MYSEISLENLYVVIGALRVNNFYIHDSRTSHIATSSQTTRTVINIPADWQQRSSSLEHHPPTKRIIKIPKLST